MAADQPPFIVPSLVAYEVRRHLSLALLPEPAHCTANSASGDLGVVHGHVRAGYAGVAHTPETP